MATQTINNNIPIPNPNEAKEGTGGTKTTVTNPSTQAPSNGQNTTANNTNANGTQNPGNGSTNASTTANDGIPNGEPNPGNQGNNTNLQNGNLQNGNLQNGVLSNGQLNQLNKDLANRSFLASNGNTNTYPQGELSSRLAAQMLGHMVQQVQATDAFLQSNYPSNVINDAVSKVMNYVPSQVLGKMTTNRVGLLSQPLHQNANPQLRFNNFSSMAHGVNGDQSVVDDMKREYFTTPGGPPQQQPANNNNYGSMFSQENLNALINGTTTLEDFMATGMVPGLNGTQISTPAQVNAARPTSQTVPNQIAPNSTPLPNANPTGVAQQTPPNPNLPGSQSQVANPLGTGVNATNANPNPGGQAVPNPNANANPVPNPSQGAPGGSPNAPTNVQPPRPGGISNAPTNVRPPRPNSGTTNANGNANQQLSNNFQFNSPIFQNYPTGNTRQNTRVKVQQQVQDKIRQLQALSRQLDSTTYQNPGGNTPPNYTTDLPRGCGLPSLRAQPYQPMHPPNTATTGTTHPAGQGAYGPVRGQSYSFNTSTFATNDPAS